MMKTSETNDPAHDGSYYFQRLSFGGTLQRMINVYLLALRPIHKIMLVMGGTFVIVWGLLLLILPDVLGINPAIEDSLYIEENAWAFLLMYVFQACCAGIFATIGHAALIRTTTDIYLQRPPSSTRSYLAIGVRYFCANLCAGILMLLGVAVGLLLLIAPGLYVGVMWLLSHIAIVVEGLGAWGGMKRSWGLVRGSWCYVFCVKFVVMFPYGVFHLAWISYVAPPHFTLGGFLVAVIPTLLIAPLVSILVTVMYINLRVQKEGLDAQALANDIGVPNEAEMATAQDNTSDTHDPTAVEGLPDFA